MTVPPVQERTEQPSAEMLDYFDRLAKGRAVQAEYARQRWEKSKKVLERHLDYTKAQLARFERLTKEAEELAAMAKREREYAA